MLDLELDLLLAHSCTLVANTTWATCYCTECSKLLANAQKKSDIGNALGIELVHFSAFESESETFEWILERPVV